MPSPNRAIFKQEIASLSYKVDVLNKKLRAKSYKVNRLKKKSKFVSNDILQSLLKHKSSHVKTFISMQVNHKKKSKWTNPEKQLSLSLFYKSPSLYKFMRNNLQFVLPSIRTIQEWMLVVNIAPGIQSSIIEKLKAKAKVMSENEKLCALLVDEISIKKEINFNARQDQAEGYEDLGHLGRKGEPATSVLMFYARGILQNWRLPLCYVTSAGTVKGEILKQLITEALKALKKCTLNPKTIVCDQGANNRKAVSLLGATIHDPTFDIDGSKIYIIYDCPHLLKSLRNNLMNEKLKFVYGEEGKIISWRDVTKAYEIDKKSSTTRSLLRLTQKHIQPNSFQKMRVLYAAQILSHSVASTIKTLIDTKQLNTETAFYTAEFISKINEIFDALNSRYLGDCKRNRRPLSVFDNNAENILKEGLNLFATIKVYEKEKLRKNLYCVEGFQISIKSILMLWDDLKTNYDVKYLMTSFLNQDPLENFFSVIRTRGGYNPMPSVRQFRISLQYYANIRLQIAVDSGNCDTDFGEFLDIMQKEEKLEEEQVNNTNITETEKQSGEDEGFRQDVEEVFERVQEEQERPITLESATEAYVAAFVAHKMIKITECEICRSYLLEEGDLSDPNYLFIINKDFSQCGTAKFLKKPSPSYYKAFSFLIKNFFFAFEKNKIKSDLSKNISMHLKPYLNRLDICNDHEQKFLNIFLKMMIYRSFQWESEKIQKAKVKKSANKPHRKVRILQN